MSSPVKDRWSDSQRPKPIGVTDDAIAAENVPGERVLWTQELTVSASMTKKHEEHLLPQHNPTAVQSGAPAHSAGRASPGYRRCRLLIRQVSKDGSFTEGWVNDNPSDGRAFVHVDVPAFQWWRAAITATEAPE